MRAVDAPLPASLRKPSRLGLAAAVVTVALLLGGCAPGRPQGSRGALFWLIAAGAVPRLLAVPGAASAVTAALDSPRTVVIGSPPRAIRSWHVRWARSATSLQGVSSVLRQAGGERLSAVVYDQEFWRFTPSPEQKDPAPYVRRAEVMAHRRGLQLIATPAVDLVRAVGKPAHGTVYETFLRLGIARQVSRFADVFEIQAQGAEADVQRYQSFVEGAATQAREANPRVVLVAGLSTNPTGQEVTAAELEADVAATRRIVSGYWLNVPSGGAYCPTCGAPQPQVGARLLESLYGRAGRR